MLRSPACRSTAAHVATCLPFPKCRRTSADAPQRGTQKKSHNGTDRIYFDSTLFALVEILDKFHIIGDPLSTDSEDRNQTPDRRVEPRHHTGAIAIG
jgi:hypothetical protein